MGYANSMGERLRAAMQAEVAQADKRLLPVLAGRCMRVDDAVLSDRPAA